MRRALVIYCTVFALSVIIPAVVCFAIKDGGSSQELVNIFRSTV